MAKYYGIATTIGEAAIANAFLANQTIEIKELAIGDGGGAYYEPTASMTTLKNEVKRINADIVIDASSPNVVQISGILPSNVGGFTVRELGAIDKNGNLIGIANVPDAPKVILEEGADTEMDLGFGFAVSHSEVISLVIDPTIIIATKKDVNVAVNKHVAEANPHPNSYYTKTESDEQLSNKVSKAFDIASGADLNTYRTEGFYRCGSAGTVPTLLNLPIEVTAAFSLHILKVWGAENGGVIQILTAHTTSQAKAAQFFRSYSPDWTPWLKVATAELPIEYPLALSSGITGQFSPTFFKDQFGRVTLWGDLSAINIFSSNQVVATLPIGYRPATSRPREVLYQTKDTLQYKTGAATVHGDGNVYISGGHVDCNRIIFDFAFST